MQNTSFFYVIGQMAGSGFAVCGNRSQKSFSVSVIRSFLLFLYRPGCTLSCRINGTDGGCGPVGNPKTEEMDILKAEFVASNTDVHKCPKADRHEYAFIGRSNVGKSSLINMLANHRKLAKTAATPGKTRLINHFMMNDRWYLVDLPGYGYARLSEAQRRQFEKMIRDYVLKRENLVCLFVLVDSRLKPQKIDLEFMEWLGENGVPFVMVFTKIDKLSAVQRLKCVDEYHQVMSGTWETTPLSFMTSAEKRLGRGELLDYIDELNKTVKI